LIDLFVYFLNIVLLSVSEIMRENPHGMVWISLMDYFYNQEYENHEDVIEAWYYYVLKYLPTVSKEWKDKIAPSKLRDQPIIFQHVSISDEALVRFFMQIWHPKVEKLMESDWIAQEKRGKGYGPHDTKLHRDTYSVIHRNIETARSNHSTALRWNNLFWNEVERRHQDLFNDLSHDRKYTGKKFRDNIVPLPGMNEDEDFWAHMNTSTKDVKVGTGTAMKSDSTPEQVASSFDLSAVSKIAHL
jgi:hypothetical protein